MSSSRSEECIVEISSDEEDDFDHLRNENMDVHQTHFSLGSYLSVQQYLFSKRPKNQSLSISRTTRKTKVRWADTRTGLMNGMKSQLYETNV